VAHFEPPAEGLDKVVDFHQLPKVSVTDPASPLSSGDPFESPAHRPHRDEPHHGAPGCRGSWNKCSTWPQVAVDHRARRQGLQAASGSRRGARWLTSKACPRWATRCTPGPEDSW